MFTITDEQRAALYVLATHTDYLKGIPGYTESVRNFASIPCSEYQTLPEYDEQIKAAREARDKRVKELERQANSEEQDLNLLTDQNNESLDKIFTKKPHFVVPTASPQARDVPNLSGIITPSATITSASGFADSPSVIPPINPSTSSNLDTTVGSNIGDKLVKATTVAAESVTNRTLNFTEFLVPQVEKRIHSNSKESDSLQKNERQGKKRTHSGAKESDPFEKHESSLKKKQIPERKYAKFERK